jgi:hypothetical protein
VAEKQKRGNWQLSFDFLTDFFVNEKQMNFDTPLPLQECVSRLEKLREKPYSAAVEIASFDFDNPEAGYEFRITSSKRGGAYTYGTLRRDEAMALTMVRTQIGDAMDRVTTLFFLVMAIVLIPITLIRTVNLSCGICLTPVIVLAGLWVMRNVSYSKAKVKLMLEDTLMRNLNTPGKVKFVEWR